MQAGALMKMRCGILVPCMMAAALVGRPSLADQRPQQDPGELVSRLPSNHAQGESVAALEQAIAKLGDPALPALEKELQLGIPFKALNVLLKNGRSRRYAVVRVLARMKSEGSTELLVKSLADTPDNLAMEIAALEALAKRTLSSDQIEVMLANRKPSVVLAGISHAAKRMEIPPIKAAVEKIFDNEHALAQFHNEYGAPTANGDVLWEVRLAAGQALKKEMVPEMQSRARHLLKQLKTEALSPSGSDDAAFMSYCSQSEGTICASLAKLAALGRPVKEVVEREAADAKEDYAKVLDMALAQLGDRSKLARVADYLVTSPDHSIRFCAAMTLNRVADRSAIPALQKALQDPYHRKDGSCVRIGDGEVYPVRLVAADALIDLGENPKAVREHSDTSRKQDAATAK